MNIISNNCIGAHIYKFNNISFNNPFMWMYMDCSDFILLATNYNKINFKNITALFEINRCGHQSVVINCDNIFNTHFIHYILNDDCVIPSKRLDNPNSVDILYNDIINYAIEKWHTRVNRMINEEPIFMYSFNYKFPANTTSFGNLTWYDNELSKIYELSKIRKTIVIMHNHELYDKYAKLENNNFKIVTANNDILFNVDKRLLTIITDKIKTFKL